MLALFESSAHPQYSVERANSSLQFLDRITTKLTLSKIDFYDPDVSDFTGSAIPIVDFPIGYETPTRCNCLTLPSSPITSVSPTHFDFSFSFNSPWDPNWTGEEIQKEECRRICWSALALVSNHTAHSAAFHERPLDLQLADPRNVSFINLHRRH